MEAHFSLGTVLDIVQPRGCERGSLKIGGGTGCIFLFRELGRPSAEIEQLTWWKIEIEEVNKLGMLFTNIVSSLIVFFFLGMEIYSTTLWHLQKEVTLSALAQDLVETDRTSPQVRKTSILERSDFLIYVHKPNVLHQFNDSPVILNHSH